jgi:glycine cleavage system H protein
VNEELDGSPELLNQDPYDSGWIAVLSMADPEELNLLLSAEDYADNVSNYDENE